MGKSSILYVKIIFLISFNPYWYIWLLSCCCLQIINLILFFVFLEESFLSFGEALFGEALFLNAKLTLNAKSPLYVNLTLNAKSPLNNNLTLNAKSPLNANLTMDGNLNLNDNLYIMNANLYTLNISCIDLNAKYVDLNASCFDLNVNYIDFNAKCLDLNVILKTKIKRNCNSNPIKTEKATYKDLNHRIKYCKLSLSGDIEVNPGPAFINPGETIHAPYSQGNADVFGENAGRQCVAMSLCSLIYVHSNGLY